MGKKALFNTSIKLSVIWKSYAFLPNVSYTKINSVSIKYTNTKKKERKKIKKGKTHCRKTGKHFYNLSIKKSFLKHENPENIKIKIHKFDYKNTKFLKGRKLCKQTHTNSHRW